MFSYTNAMPCNSIAAWEIETKYLCRTQEKIQICLSNKLIQIRSYFTLLVIKVRTL